MTPTTCRPSIRPRAPRPPDAAAAGDARRSRRPCPSRASVSVALARAPARTPRRRTSGVSPAAYPMGPLLRSASAAADGLRYSSCRNPACCPGDATEAARARSRRIRVAAGEGSLRSRRAAAPSGSRHQTPDRDPTKMMTPVPRHLRGPGTDRAATRASLGRACGGRRVPASTAAPPGRKASRLRSRARSSCTDTATARARWCRAPGVSSPGSLPGLTTRRTRRHKPHVVAGPCGQRSAPGPAAGAAAPSLDGPGAAGPAADPRPFGRSSSPRPAPGCPQAFPSRGAGRAGQPHHRNPP
mmetsp:Transcript_140562/g.449284  ORF Transcript_140562/g.449284 Transcript_140562/m.449284 type:complete len:299 (-) Transcript_140562:1410-2306(-)